MDFYFNSIYRRLSKDFGKDRECSFTSSLLSEKIITQNGCYYFESHAPKYLKEPPEVFDRTGNECFHNKIFIGSIIEDSSAESKFECGILFAEKLAAKLSVELGDGFNVLFSFDMENAFVRFHKIRIGESWLDDDLESYRLEAILKIVV